MLLRTISSKDFSSLSPWYMVLLSGGGSINHKHNQIRFLQMHRNNRAHPITDRGQGSVSDPILNVDDDSASFSVFSVACNMGIPFDFVFGFFYFVFQPSFSESQEIWLFFLAHLSQEFNFFYFFYYYAFLFQFFLG